MRLLFDKFHFSQRSTVFWCVVRVGTYEGHTGAVYYIDVNDTSTLVATASADETVRIWELETGKQLFQVRKIQARRCLVSASLKKAHFVAFCLHPA